MADTARQPPKAIQQQFGHTAVNDNSLLFQGIVHGDVHLNQRPVTPPSPTAIIPFGRDPDFVDRKEIDRVHELCAKPASQTALLGLGGVGKSQIAIEYAYRVRERSPETWVFWIHASNAARYEQSFRDVAEYLKIPGRRDSQSNIFELLSHWLREEKRGKWVVILDNLDEAGFFFDVSHVGSAGQSQNQGRSTPLRSYLPYCQHGAVLVTTRSRDVAFRLVEECNIVRIEPMNAIDALSLAEKKLGGLVRQTDIESTQALIKALEYMPLAIAQATAYIGHKTPRCSIKQYLEKFEQGDRKKVGLLDYDRGQLRRDREAKNSIITTWQISFDHIREARQSATDLLSLMSFCDRQGIPESLLRASDYEGTAIGSHQKGISIADSEDEKHTYGKEPSDDESDSDFSAAEAFEQDLSTLMDYSFISTSDGGTFQMHRLVQLATRKWLQAKGQEDRWKHEFIDRLASQFPTGEYENWSKCQELLPHATSAAAQRPKTEDSSAAWTGILYRAAWYFLKKGQGPEAQKMAEATMEATSKRLGRTHDDTLHSMDMVGRALMIQGRWKAAEKLFVEVMETRKQKLGLDHPDTLTSMANLASTYWNQGRWDKAEELEVEVMETRKQKLGLDHPHTLTSMANLASTYRNQGRWDKAEELEVEVMETRKQKLGLDHPDTLTAMNNLAYTWARPSTYIFIPPVFNYLACRVRDIT
ncbi:putative kinesin [Microdochium trichocladiopsis]|uniref:Kinesin n=1 Tax=Microdochium trichocladiopsis TaxID=1682393 RepID=A0A9P9BIS3_9PEZI|nr:putative kinesin [Microdochium trichocladiopsis]KAH7012593.1 putative kinesin [Microdochium trichocladiopsis]